MEVIEKITYIGANRRSTRTVVEECIVFDNDELDAVATLGSALARRLASILMSAGVDQELAEQVAAVREADPRSLFCRLYTGTAVALQTSGGHRVEVCQSIPEDDPRRCRAIFEYEQENVGEQAGRLALAFMQHVCPFIQLEAGDQIASEELGALLEEFQRFASSLALPADTQAIIEAAESADIPYLKLDRAPFEPVPDEQRIRPNGTVQLGHARFKHVVDGTFCVDRSSSHIGLLRDREQILEFLESLGLPLPDRDREFTNCSTRSRARRTASRVGYPLVLKPILKHRGLGVSTNIRDDSGLYLAFEEAQNYGRRVLIERHIPGDEFRIIVANRQLVAVVHVDSVTGHAREVTGEVHGSVIESAHKVAAALEVGILVLTFISTDISKPLDQNDGAFVDLDVAPELDAFLSPDSAHLSSAASLFLRWLFPDGAVSRIPLVAVTGTNGKTTTSRMIRALLNHAGYVAGMACSEGVFLDGSARIEKGDLAGVVGHYMILSSPEINCAVLETARGAVLKMGLGFDHCDLSVCLNVTEDHLEECGIDTVEQMAEVKRSIASRARRAVVLNADDPLCLSMLPFPETEQTCLVSIKRPVQALRGLGADSGVFSTIEEIDDEYWVTLHDGDEQFPVAPVSDIPAAFGGMAEYNLANVLHACAACFLAGISVDTIREGISRFEMNFENTPGRLNFFDDLPFRFVLDYAHNPDGIARFCAFIDQIPVSGRRIVAFSAAGYNPDETIRANAAAVAGHFDLYWCYNFPRNIQQHHHQVPQTLRESLLQCGVPETSVNLAGTGLAAVDTILDLAQEGDLVAFLSGHTERDEIWKRVNLYGKR